MINSSVTCVKSLNCRFMSIPENANEYIQLDQFLKFMNLVGSGGEAKVLIRDGQVSVNGEPETRRGRKLREGDLVEFAGQKYKVELSSRNQKP